MTEQRPICQCVLCNLSALQQQRGEGEKIVDIDVRAYEEGDEGSIRTLFDITYGRSMDHNLWQWRFRDNPAGESIIQLAWDNSVLAGHYAVVQAMLSIDGKEVRSGLDVTTMTHPDYRGRGLFRTLAKASYERSAQSGLEIVWGFPNRNSHRGYTQDLGWVDIWEIPTLRLSLPPRVNLPLVSSSVVQVPSFDRRFDCLWEEVKFDYYVIARRDSEYLHWRYASNPKGQYRILVCQYGPNLLGYAVFKRYMNELQVVDLLVKEDIEIGLQLLSEIARIGVEESAEAVSLWLNVTHPLHRALERLGFENGAPVTYFAGLILGEDTLDRQVYDYRNWYITMGDSDVY